MFHWLTTAVKRFTVLAGLIGASVSHAAEVDIKPFPEVGSWQYPFYSNELDFEPFKISLNGPIEQGDAEKLRAAYQMELVRQYQIRGLSLDEPPLPFEHLGIVSLHSEGGDFREGIEIGKVIREFGMPTLVEKDASCLSACAVAFMAGFQYEIESDPFRSRHLQAGGELGFHRPFLDRVEGFDITNFEGLSQEEVDEVMSAEYSQFYDLANELIQEMLATDPSAWPNELLLRMLLASSDEDGQPSFTYLNKVGEAIEWDINVIGVALPELKTRTEFLEEIWWLCHNSSFLQMPSLDWRETAPLGSPFDRASSFISESKTEFDQVFNIEIWGLTGEGCEVRHSLDGAILQSNNVYVDTRSGTGLFNLYHPKTELKNIMATHAASNTDREMRLKAQLGRCWVFKGETELDSQQCQVENTVINTGDGDRNISTYIWPSGNRTVVEQQFTAHDLINGEKAEFLFKDGFQSCHLNTKSGNTFCYSLE